VLLGDECGHILLAVVQQLAELEEDLGALGQRGVPPGRKRSRRNGHGLVEGGARGEVDRLGHLARRRVVDVAGALGRALPELAVDPVGDVCGHVRFLRWWVVMQLS